MEELKTQIEKLFPLQFNEIVYSKSLVTIYSYTMLDYKKIHSLLDLLNVEAIAIIFSKTEREKYLYTLTFGITKNERKN